jgi:hypothetical protein
MANAVCLWGYLWNMQNVNNDFLSVEGLTFIFLIVLKFSMIYLA